MADQINIAGLNLGPGAQQPGGRSYIPPHLRNRPSGPPPMNGAPADAPAAAAAPVAAAAPAAAPAPNGAPAGAPVNGLGQSAWAVK